MPELAEVESFRKRWDAGLGQRVLAVRLHGAKRIFRGTDVADLRQRLVRQRLLHSFARGKQMLFQFSGDNWLGIHLGMSGHLRVEPRPFTPAKHDHLVLEQRAVALVLRDARQFGRVRFHHGKSEPGWWQAIGPALASARYRREMMTAFLSRHARAPIKAVLLLQSGFPGIGNWMADEILWRARIAPNRKAGVLPPKEIGALWRSLRFVTRAALRTIGHDDSDPPRGWLLHERWRAGGKCPRHGTPLRRATIGGRTTAWCARCQPARSK